MAAISILVPAYKPDYIQATLLSAQGQMFRDIEILVGDDTPDARLEPIVRRVGDSRVRYFHHGFQNAELNLKGLWQHATGRYIKWLFDDDLLLPRSIDVLAGALDAHPGSALAFHERLLVDGRGAIIRKPSALLERGRLALLNRNVLVGSMIGKIRNYIGEPSNTMVRREMVDIDTVFTYRSLALDFLTDVAMYMNLSVHAPLVMVGGCFSAFRQHAGQNSSSGSPRMSAGVYEWEMFVRSEAADGHLDDAGLREARRKLKRLYAGFTGRYPEIARLDENLDELVHGARASLFESPRFQADLSAARAAVAARIETGKNKAA